MQDLIERLERTTGPSRELDCLIGVAIGRFEAQQGYGADRIDYVEHRPDGGILRPGHGGDQLIPLYTWSFDAARTLIPDGFYWLVSEGKTRADEPLGGAQVFRPNYLVEPISQAEHESAILALCIAALKARASISSTHSTTGE